MKIIRCNLRTLARGNKRPLDITAHGIRIEIDKQTDRQRQVSVQRTKGMRIGQKVQHHSALLQSSLKRNDTEQASINVGRGAAQHLSFRCDAVRRLSITVRPLC